MVSSRVAVISITASLVTASLVTAILKVTSTDTPKPLPVAPTCPICQEAPVAVVFHCRHTSCAKCLAMMWSSGAKYEAPALCWVPCHMCRQEVWRVGTLRKLGHLGNTRSMVWTYDGGFVEVDCWGTLDEWMRPNHPLLPGGRPAPEVPAGV